MDTSETYIKMCDCEEIQKNRIHTRQKCTWQDGDMFYYDDSDTAIMYDSCSHSEGMIEPEVYRPDCIWLPRQDQLQEMVGFDGTGWELWKILSLFESFLHNRDDDYPSDFTSFEQLWLAFVMNKLYSRRWDGEQWK